MNLDFDEKDGFNVNYEKILFGEKFLPVTRLLAADLIKKQYMPIGDFIQSLKNDTLEELNDISEDQNHKNFDQIVLISEMLAAAEGTNVGGLSNAHLRVNTFITWLVFESLKRKGLVKIHYQNISFGEDMGDKVVVEKI